MSYLPADPQQARDLSAGRPSVWAWQLFPAACCLGLALWIGVVWLGRVLRGEPVIPADPPTNPQARTEPVAPRTLLLWSIPGACGGLALVLLGVPELGGGLLFSATVLLVVAVLAYRREAC